MDAKERLRRYLEQRREMGESDLVLDAMTVEDVLRIVGAPASSSGASVERAASLRVEPESNAPRVGEAVANEGDWRQALRASGASPSQDREPAEGRVPPSRVAETPGPRIESREPKAESSVPSAPVAPGIVVGQPITELFGGPLSSFTTIDDLANAIASCTRCPLSSSAKNPVPGEGNPNADFVCVGEAPGQTEDETGRPFVGAAGQLLTKILAAINLSREDVFICNVLKHRPPGNRNPLPPEVTACSPYLVRQLELIRPKVILALGTFAAQTLLGTTLSIGKLRGAVHTYYGIPLVVTYHPAALLRNPSWKRPTWEDVQLARRILDRPSVA